MSDPNADRDDVVRVDFEFRRELAEKVEGNLASFCYQCGACVGDCPSARFSEDFNPRQIMQAVLYGLEEEVVGESSPVWQCSNCFTCFDRCPQNVKPIEVIIALKNLMRERGIVPKGVDRLVEGLRKTGRSAMVTSATHRRREELGLPPLPELDLEPLEILLAEFDFRRKGLFAASLIITFLVIMLYLKLRQIEKRS